MTDKEGNLNITPEILDKILLISSNSISAIELINKRLSIIEDNISEISNSINGKNDEVGLSEKFRSTVNELKNIKESIECIEDEINGVKEMYKEYSKVEHRIIGIEAKQKIMIGIMSAIGLAVLSLIGKIVYQWIITVNG